MKLEKVFYNVKCDGCGELLDETYWSEEAIDPLLLDSDWKTIRGKHYCPKCHHYGDDNELILGDGTVIKEEEDDWV